MLEIKGEWWMVNREGRKYGFEGIPEYSKIYTATSCGAWR
jgi:hypothetical protein